MRMMTTVFAVVLATAACVYLLTRTSPIAPLPVAAIQPVVADVRLEGAPATAIMRRLLGTEQPASDLTAALGSHVLRVILEGITAERAGMTRVTLTAVNEAKGRRSEIREFVSCQGLASEFDLDPFLAEVAERGESENLDELEIEVDHPLYLRERARVSLARGVDPTIGKTVHEVRVRLVRPEFWPEFTLDVRDADTRAHLGNIVLRSGPGVGSAMWGRNPPSSLLSDEMSSPITLMGGRDADEPGTAVAHLALRPAEGESPRLVKLEHSIRPGRGINLYARAPGYAWGSIVIDLSKNEPRELLLGRGSAIEVRMKNVQLERYRALDTEPLLCVYWIRKDGGNQYVHFEPLDETLSTDGLRLDGLRPGGYRVAVELGGGAWTKRPVLAREELSGEHALVAGQTRKMELVLAAPPRAPERTTLGGVISLPAGDLEERVRLQIYFQPNQRWRKPDVEFSLADLQRVHGALPSWSFRVENLPVGMYRVQLLPFLNAWMIELPTSGHKNVKLALPELAEVLVETIDGQTGKRVPLDEFHYRREKRLPGQKQIDTARAGTDEPGRFRFWTAPGAVSIWPRGQGRLGYGRARMNLELVPGRQSVRFALAPACRIRFEFRVEGATPRLSDEVWNWMHYGTLESIHAVDHGGRSLGRVGKQLAEVSAPGVYKIDFEGFTKDRFHPIPPRLVFVRAGEATKVIVELRRK